MTDEQLLQTLGELHVKSEDTHDKRDFGRGVRRGEEANHYQALSRQIEFIEEQLEGARQVWMVRKHAKQTVAEWSKEVTALNTQLATAHERFDKLPTIDRSYAEERLKFAILAEQNHLAGAAEPLVKKNSK